MSIKTYSKLLNCHVVVNHTNTICSYLGSYQFASHLIRNSLCNCNYFGSRKLNFSLVSLGREMSIIGFENSLKEKKLRFANICELLGFIAHRKNDFIDLLVPGDGEKCVISTLTLIKPIFSNFKGYPVVMVKNSPARNNRISMSIDVCILTPEFNGFYFLVVEE